MEIEWPVLRVKRNPTKKKKKATLQVIEFRLSHKYSFFLQHSEHRHLVSL